MELGEEEKAIETLKEVASNDFDTLGDDISPRMAQNILTIIFLTAVLILLRIADILDGGDKDEN